MVSKKKVDGRSIGTPNVQSYRNFLSKEMIKMRANHPEIDNRDYFGLIAKKWNAYKIKNNIVSGVDNYGSKNNRKSKSRSKSKKY